MFLLWKQLGKIVAEVGNDLLKFLDPVYFLVLVLPPPPRFYENPYK
jgi:hypothetical protein